MGLFTPNTFENVFRLCVSWLCSINHSLGNLVESLLYTEEVRCSPVGYDVASHLHMSACELHVVPNWWFSLIGSTVAVLVLVVIDLKRMPSDSVIGNARLSWLLSWLITFSPQPFFHACTLRSLFAKSPIVRSAPARNHSHPQSASLRNDGVHFMDLFAKSVGLRAYYLQRSAADVRAGRAGCRSYHWAKDVSVESSEFSPAPDDLICISDVDMYLDMPHLLANHAHTYLISTVQPSAVAATGGEYSFTFGADAQMVYDVAGGATYKHPVWNYATDILIARHRTLWSTTVTIYNVDRRQTDLHHQLVLLTCIRSICIPHIFFGLDTFLSGDRLRRLNPVVTLTRRVEPGQSSDVRQFLRLNVNTAKGLLRSTGKPGSYCVATIPADLDDTLSSMALTSTQPLSQASIRMTLEECDQSTATMLVEYHRYKSPVAADFVCPLSESVYAFQHAPSSKVDFEATLPVIPFMSPIVLGCYVPVRSVTNDEAAVKGRIVDVASTAELTPTMVRAMDIFLQLLIPDNLVGKLHPVDIDEVFARQKRPTQQQILQNAAQSTRLASDEPIRTFQKSEAYGKITDPRIISTIPGVQKLHYSSYLYAAADAVKVVPCYAFGKTPLAVAERVAAICSRAKTIVKTDLSRCDGRISAAARAFESAFMMRLFAQRHHQNLAELMATQKNQIAYTHFGVKYDTGNARASGSPETALFNTLLNMLMAFDTLLRMGFSPEEAWALLGVFGGDDGLSSDMDTDLYIKVCKDYGQILEAEVVRRGQEGVEFLARLYGPEVWHGSPDSMCDVARQLSKLHVTTSLPKNVTALQKLGEKLLAFSYTDENTPIIGQLVRSVRAHHPDIFPRKLSDDVLRGVAYAHASEGPDQYPNKDTGWMLECVKRQMPTFNFERFDKWLATLDNPEQLLRPPLCASAESHHSSKSSVIVNGELLGSRPREQIPRVKAKLSPEDYETKKRQSKEMPCPYAGKCRHLASGKCWYKHA